MNKLEELESERINIMSKISAIKDAEQIKTNALLVGNCYKVSNSYSGDEKHWWLYTIVHRQNDDGDLDITQFEICSDGKIEIIPRDYFLPYDGYIEITTGELSKAWKNTLDAARSMLA